MTNNEITFTKFTSTKPKIISKGFSLNQAGKLEKKPGGAMQVGTAERITVKGIREMGEVVQSLNPSQALTYGLPTYTKALVVTKKHLKSTKARIKKKNVISRTREHFRYSKGAGAMMVDYDPVKGQKPMAGDEFREKVYSVWPEIRNAPHILIPSASSYIYHGEKCLKGPGGWRLLVMVKHANDIPRAGKAFFERCWLAGLGHIAISKSGAMLPQTIIDASVWQPERLDFVSGAACEPPLEQRRPAPEIFNPDAEPLNTAAKLKSLSLSEETEYQRLMAEAKEKAQPEADVVRDKWVDERIQDGLADVPAEKKKETEKALRKTYTSAAKMQILRGNFVLYPANGKPMTVAEALDDPGKWNGTRFADPMEPDYGNDNRIAIANLKTAGRPYIYSHAHGGQRYVLHQEREIVHLIEGERVQIVQKALAVMLKNGSHFQRGGEIVCVSTSGKVIPRDKEGIRYDLDAAIEFSRFDERKQAFLPCDCKLKIPVGVLAAKSSWRLPELTATATAPTLDPLTDRLIDDDGYDPQTGLMMILGDVSAWQGIPGEPKAGDVEQAIKTLWQPFKDFPFDGPVSIGVMLAALLTACIRSLLPTAPGYCFTAPTAGSGKSLLAKCLSIIAGVTAAMLPNAGDPEEIRKRLLALLRQNQRVMVLDNVVGTLDSAALCAMLTAEVYSDRVLGVSETIAVPTRTLLLITGNNVALKGDLCRRVLTSRIDPKMETPWKRSFGLDPGEYCRTHRLEIVAAALTVLRAGIQHGPTMPDRTASFELWSDTVRRAVCFVGEYGFMDLADPVDSIDLAYGQDPETQKLSALFSAWWALFDDKPVKIATLIKHGEWMNGNDLANPELNAALDEIAGDGRGVNSRRLGRWIEKNRERIIDDMRVISQGKLDGVRQWRLRRA